MDTIATTINGHSATTQKERFQSGFSGVGFLFMPLSQAFEDRHFRKRDCFSDTPPGRSFQNGNENTQALLFTTVRLAIRVVDLVLGNWHRAAVGFFWQMLARAGDVLISNALTAEGEGRFWNSGQIKHR